MRAGELRNRIALLPPNITPDAWGAIEAVPDAVQGANGISVRRVWAGVKALTGKKTAGADGVQSSTTYQIKIRYQEGVTPEWRIAHCGKYFDIIDVVDKEGRKRELEITAVEYHG